MNKKTTYVAQAGMIAAVYAAATLVTVMFLGSLAWGPIQFRVSEALCVLALFTPAAVPGLTLGCAIANIANIALSGTGMLGMDNRNALRIFRRDRNHHKSPNAGQTEAACAGALHIRLGGDASYFGKTVKKAAFGDPDKEISRSDILRAADLMTAASALALTLGAAVRLTTGWPPFG